MAEELRALMRDELSDERPPPLGDLVADAMRDGRRIRCNRRIGVFGSAAAVFAAVAVGATVAWPSAVTPGPVPGGTATGALAGSAQTSAPPQPVVTGAPTDGVPAPEATVTSVPLHGAHATGRQKRATPQAVLELLTRALPAGRTSNYVANDDDGLFAQIYLDTGRGPGMLRVWLKPSSGKDAERGHARVEVFGLPDNCVQSTVVQSSFATGGHLEMNIATCLASDKPAPSPLTVQQALQVASDARWGMRMDADLVDAGAKRFANVPKSTD